MDQNFNVNRKASSLVWTTDGRHTEDGACLYYKLTHEPNGSGELIIMKKKIRHHLKKNGLVKGPGLIRGFFLFCVINIHIIKAICHSYQDCAQKFVCMLTVAMEILTNKVKMTFFIIYDIFLLFQKLPIKISIPYHARTNTKLLL